ncbi:hypothetical protein AWB79_01087 [Caballeronia hypogeia]|uniref:Transposase IS3/IS911 family protein n=1 Tax=Caballeronia hypogeia TaxID=1777140 RepID=A0A157ZKY6_9BURK|nr:hypothetical protein [Caballeronia hypogeia]SAK46178.1 hypothetical protein AWB79_01087 [Caballeronia hypogeia]
MTGQVANDDDEGTLQAQLRRISELEEENTALREVNDLLRKAVAYYAPVSAALFPRDDA